jgi:hypothetical protein
MAMNKIGHHASRIVTQESSSDKPRSKSAKRPLKKPPRMKVKNLARQQANEVLSHIQSREQGNNLYKSKTLI